MSRFSLHCWIHDCDLNKSLVHNRWPTPCNSALAGLALWATRFFAGMSACLANIVLTCFDTSTDTHIICKYTHSCLFERTIAKKCPKTFVDWTCSTQLWEGWIFETVQVIDPLMATKTQNCAVMCSVCDVYFRVFRISLLKFHVDPYFAQNTCCSHGCLIVCLVSLFTVYSQFIVDFSQRTNTPWRPGISQSCSARVPGWIPWYSWLSPMTIMKIWLRHQIPLNIWNKKEKQVPFNHHLTMIKTSSGGPLPPWSIGSLRWMACWPRWRVGVGSSNSRSRGEGRTGEVRRN